MIRLEFMVLTLLWAGAATAQQPLSAIDWLDKPNSLPELQAPATKLNEPPVTSSADVPGVDVTPLGQATPDSVGLLPTATTGLPRSLWQASNVQDLTEGFAQLQPDILPAAQALSYTLLLAEADAPSGTGTDAAFLKARIHTLVRFGAVDPARALIERAGPDRLELFDLWLNLALLSGDEDKPCAILAETPTLSSDYAARIFCTARAGDWNTASLTYGTAVAIGAITGTVADLLAQFIDPEMIDEMAAPTPPTSPSPLVFRLFEANGTPLPTRTLPRAFSMADLRGTAGWKAELEAAERLAQSGALPATRLLGVYTDRRPAASGGVWDRVAAIQAFDNALFRRNPELVAQTMPKAWQMAKAESLAVPFAQLFGEALMKVDLPADARPEALRIALLSPQYEAAADHFSGSADPVDDFLRNVAKGALSDSAADIPWASAILEGMRATGPSYRHKPLLDDGKLGEAILQATIDLGTARRGDIRDATEALKTLRAVGLEDAARRAALQMLILGSGN